MRLIGMNGFGGVIRLVSGSSQDLGDWLCKMLGICA